MQTISTNTTVETAAVPRPPRARRGPLAGLLALVALLYVGTAPVSDLYDENDTQYAGGAREMVRSGNWAVPTNNYLPRLQKPPLVYWLTAPSLWLLGENEFAARLPTALMACLLAAFTYGIGRRIGGEWRGFMAGLALMMCFGTFIFGKMIMPEPYMTCLVTGALWCVLNGYQDAASRRRWYLAAWAFAALASLCKGMHGFLYPAFTVAGLALVTPSARTALRPLLSVGGVLVFLAIWAPWYAAMEIKFPGFLYFQFYNEQVGHVMGTHYPKDDTPIPFIQFILQHGIWFFPWTLFAPAALITWFRHVKEHTGDPLLERLPLAWMFVVGLAMMISTRQDYYGMTAWPAFALWLSQLWTSPRLGRRVVRNLIRGAVVFFLVIGLAGLAAAALEQYWLNGGAAPSAIPAASRDNFVNALEGFSLASWRQMLPIMWTAFGALTLGGAIAAMLVWRGREAAAAVTMGIAMLGPLAGAARGMRVMSPYFSLADIARHLNKITDPGDKVLYEGESHAASSLFFYLDHQVHWLGVPSDIEFACRAHHLGEDKFPPESALPALWKGPDRIFLIIEESRLDYWAGKLGIAAANLKPLAVSGTRLVVSNR